MARASGGYLTGLAEAEAKLRQLGAVVAAPIMKKAVRAGIQPAKQRAQQNAPTGQVAHRTYKGRLVAPGFGKRSIRVITTASQDKRTFSAALGVRREAHYMVNFVEVGSAKMAAQPWLRPAMAATKDEQEVQFAEVVLAEIRKVTG